MNHAGATSTSPTGTFGVRTAGVLVLGAGLIALVQVTLASGYTFAEDPPEVLDAMGSATNRGFFTWVVFSALVWALLAGGVAALVLAVFRTVQSTITTGLAAGAAAMTAIGGALRAVDPAVLAGLVNRWPEEGELERVQVIEGGEVKYLDPLAPLKVIDEIRFGLEQAGFGVLAIAMFLLSAVLFASGRVLHPFVGAVPFFIGLYWLAQISAGDGVSPLVAGIGLPFLGIAVLATAHLRSDL